MYSAPTIVQGVGVGSREQASGYLHGSFQAVERVVQGRYRADHVPLVGAILGTQSAQDAALAAWRHGPRRALLGERRRMMIGASCVRRIAAAGDEKHACTRARFRQHMTNLPHNPPYTHATLILTEAHLALLGDASEAAGRERVVAAVVALHLAQVAVARAGAYWQLRFEFRL